MKYVYAIIPFSKAEKLNLTDHRQSVNDLTLINCDDLLTDGSASESFSDKVERLGGKILTRTEAIKFINNK